MADVKPEYYLKVDFAVAEGDAREFERLMSRLLQPHGVLARSGWSLVLSLRSAAAYPLRPDEIVNDGRPELGERNNMQSYESFDTQLRGVDPKTARYTRYLHLWRLPAPSGIADVMRSLGDDDEYIALDALVEREVQEVLFWNPTPHLPSLPAAPPEPDGFVYLYARREFASLALTQYLTASVATSIALRTKQQDAWSPLGFLRNATGSLNYITEFWKTPVQAEILLAGQNEVHTLAAFRAALESVPPGVIRASDIDNATDGLLRQEFRFPMVAVKYVEVAK